MRPLVLNKGENAIAVDLDIFNGIVIVDYPQPTPEQTMALEGSATLLTDEDVERLHYSKVEPHLRYAVFPKLGILNGKATRDIKAREAVSILIDDLIALKSA